MSLYNYYTFVHYVVYWYNVIHYNIITYNIIIYSFVKAEYIYILSSEDARDGGKMIFSLT